ncbi:MAG: hypothetical protein MJZ56_01115 [Bacteroidales bacterium]|nr:hypothetical protein [Bacteroidales bacterium]
MKIKLFIIAIMSISIITSCKKNDNDATSDVSSIGKGVFVLNEGGFTVSNSSLTFYDTEMDTVCNNLFYKVNGGIIGDVAQSLTLADDNLFIVVNNSNYIYKTDANTLKIKGNKAEGFVSPRHLLVVNDEKAYVSDIAAKGLWIVNTETMQTTGFIETGNTTEKMVMIGDEVFVCNWSNYYQPQTSDASFQVIDTRSDELVGTYGVGEQPNSIVVDCNENIWILCGGEYDYTYWTVSGAKLCRVNPKTLEIKDFKFADGGYTSPSSLCIDDEGEKLYFLNGDVFEMNINDLALPTKAFASADGRSFYSVAVSPEGDVFVTDAKDYQSNGSVIRYSSDGEEKAVFDAGVCPQAMAFN